MIHTFTFRRELKAKGWGVGRGEGGEGEGRRRGVAVSGWKLPEENIRDKGNSALTDLTGFLLNLGQGDETSPVGDGE